MDLISRKDAIAKGLGKYFTGSPCRNGHIAERYVQSGTCEECIRESKAIAVIPRMRAEILPPERMEIMKSRVNLEQQKLALKSQRLSIEQQKLQMSIERQEERREDRAVKEHRSATVKSRLMNVNLLAHPLDYEQIGTIAWAAAFARDPLLRREDVVTGRKGCEKDDPIYVMKCFPEDREVLLKVADEIWSRRSAPRAERDRAEILAKVEAERAAKDEKDWPELNCK